MWIRLQKLWWKHTQTQNTHTHTWRWLLERWDKVEIKSGDIPYCHGITSEAYELHWEWPINPPLLSHLLVTLISSIQDNWDISMAKPRGQNTRKPWAGIIPCGILVSGTHLVKPGLYRKATFSMLKQKTKNKNSNSIYCIMKASVTNKNLVGIPAISSVGFLNFNCLMGYLDV